MSTTIILDDDNTRLLMLAYEEACIQTHAAFKLWTTSVFGGDEKRARLAYHDLKACKDRLAASLRTGLRYSLTVVEMGDLASVNESDADADDWTAEPPANLVRPSDDDREAARQAAFGAAVAHWEMPEGDGDGEEQEADTEELVRFVAKSA